MATSNPYQNSNKNNQNQNTKDQKKDNNYMTITPQSLPDDFVEEAERVTYDHIERYGDNIVTTSKLRTIYQLFLDIYNQEALSKDLHLSTDSLNKLKMLHVKILYEAGRDTASKENPLKDFVEKSNIIAYIKDIGNDREKFIKTTQYFEALIAYHRFYVTK